MRLAFDSMQNVAGDLGVALSFCHKLHPAVLRRKLSSLQPNFPAMLAIKQLFTPDSFPAFVTPLPIKSLGIQLCFRLYTSGSRSSREAQIKNEGNGHQAAVQKYSPRPQFMWTQERCELLQQLCFSEKLTPKECARRLEEQTGANCSPAVVHHKLKIIRQNTRIGIPVMGVPRQKWTEAETATLKTHLSKNRTVREISDLMKRSTNSVYKKLRSIEKSSEWGSRRLSPQQMDYLINEVERYTKAGQRPAWTRIGKSMNKSGTVLQNVWELRVGSTRKGRFTEEEDKKLLSMISLQRSRAVTWSSVAAELHRSGKSVRDRWLSLNRTNRTEDDGSAAGLF
ncbi:hypothetical protein DFJ77DRAFT_238666 [Powellomyces hirtus]|nr:hypothetical protein DFJ77DRAFT_238666 [Powellomyces hirtus]